MFGSMQKMPNKPIAVFCHWHTGSSILMRVLEACGVNLGNEKTWWDEDCIAQREHSYLNGVGDQFYLGRGNQELLAGARAVLRAYKEQAELNSWKFYGVKITHILQETCWKHLSPIFEDVWSPYDIVIQLRHPLEIIKSTTLRASSWGADRVLESIEQTYSTLLKLTDKKNVHLLIFPVSHTDGKVQELVTKLGLTWNRGASKLFSKDKIVSTSTMEERNEFANRYPKHNLFFSRMVQIYEENP